MWRQLSGLLFPFMWIRYSFGLLLLLYGLLLATSSHAAPSSSFSYPDTDEWLLLNVNKKQIPVVAVASLIRPEGNVIIIQGKDEQRFEWDILFFLRHRLAEKGWNTLGLNIPKPPGRLVFLEPEQQLAAAIELLQKKNSLPIYVMLFGEGAGALLSQLATSNNLPVKGILLISSYAQRKASYEGLIKAIDDWTYPLFDIKAQYDYSQVNLDQRVRDQIFEKRPSHYRPFTLLGANHTYSEAQEVLLKWVYGWMSKQSTR